ncbi:MAG: FliO/MopB family protein [Alphaproteobacteria bacterium]|nr:FliO/MopB family protein [Alphaproteobacteria bacterium]
METERLMTAMAAFAFVVCLMYGLAWIVKRLGLTGAPMLAMGAKRRLKIVEQLAIDPRHKLVIVRRDNKEHLIVMGPGGDTVVESNIPVIDNVVELEQKEAKNG